MTKTELCNMVVSNHFKSNDSVNDYKILQSSTLAVAMEFLGLIEAEEMKHYAASRGGIVFSGNTGKGFTTFSFRDLLSLLPD